MIVALIRATTDSLVICLKVSFASNELLARPCTIMAEDCVPTFPPVCGSDVRIYLRHTGTYDTGKVEGRPSHRYRSVYCDYQ